LDKPLHVIYKVSKLAYRIPVILIANKRVKKTEWRHVLFMLPPPLENQKPHEIFNSLLVLAMGPSLGDGPLSLCLACVILGSSFGTRCVPLFE
jgi:hypothetical protein